jgi:outer membrane autotransporter protein
MGIKRIGLAASVSVAALISAAKAAETYRIIPPAGHFVANSRVAENGTTVFTFASRSPATWAQFGLWSPSGGLTMLPLGPHANALVSLGGISGDGSLVAAYATPPVPQQNFVWKSGRDILPLTSVSPKALGHTMTGTLLQDGKTTLQTTALLPSGNINASWVRDGQVVRAISMNFFDEVHASRNGDVSVAVNAGTKLRSDGLLFSTDNIGTQLFRGQAAAVDFKPDVALSEGTVRSQAVMATGVSLDGNVIFGTFAPGGGGSIAPVPVEDANARRGFRAFSDGSAGVEVGRFIGQGTGAALPTSSNADGSAIVGNSVRWTLADYGQISIVGISLSEPQAAGESWTWDEIFGTRPLSETLGKQGVDTKGYKIVDARLSGDGATLIGQLLPDGAKTWAMRRAELVAGRATEAEIAMAQDLYQAGLQTIAVTGLVQNRYLGPGGVKQSLALGAGEKSRIGLLGGSGSVTIGTGGLLTVGGNNDSSDPANGRSIWSGAISGAGGVEKTGTGTWIVSGKNTYTGPTLVNGGMLLLTGQLTSNVSIASGAALQVGDGVRAGDLRGDARIAGTLLFEQPGDYTYAGALSGAGALVKRGSGTLSLSGENLFTGLTSVQAGRLSLTGLLSPSSVLSLDGGVLSLSRDQRVAGLLGNGGALALEGASLTVDQPGDTTFSGAITGTGAFVKTGSGSLNLTGANTFSGPTTINGGRLAVNGSLLNSLVTVETGGVLGGNGTVGGIVLQGGVVSPGNSIGQLNTSGNIVFGPGSTYLVETNAAGQSDRIVTSGTASLGNGTVQVLAEQGNYELRTTYTILTAAGGVSGQFGTVSTNLAFLTPTLSYGANNVLLTLRRNDVLLSDVAMTRNQAAVAGALEGMAISSPVLTALIGGTAEEARGAFNQLAGEVHANAVSTLYTQSATVRDAVMGRLRGGQPPEGTTGAALESSRNLDPRVFGVWGQGFGGWGRTDRDANAGAVNRSNAGFVLGADASFDSRWRIGVAGGYAHSRFDTASRLSSGTIDGGFAALYGATSLGPVNLRAGASYGQQTVKTSRTVLFRSFSSASTANYDASTAQAFAELGYRFQLGAIALEPFVNGAAIRIHTDNFAEQGGAASLNGASRDHVIGTTTLGLRGDYAFSNTPIIVRAMLGWRLAYGDLNPSARLAFQAPASAQFLSTAVPLDRNSLVSEFSLDWRLSNGASLGLLYAGAYGATAQDQSVKGRFEMTF